MRGTSRPGRFARLTGRCSCGGSGRNPSGSCNRATAAPTSQWASRYGPAASGTAAGRIRRWAAPRPSPPPSRHRRMPGSGGGSLGRSKCGGGAARPTEAGTFLLETWGSHPPLSRRGCAGNAVMAATAKARDAHGVCTIVVTCWPRVLTKLVWNVATLTRSIVPRAFQSRSSPIVLLAKCSL